MKLYLEIIEDLLQEEWDDGEVGLDAKEEVADIEEARTKFKDKVKKDYGGRAYHGFVHKCYHDEPTPRRCEPIPIGRMLMCMVIDKKEAKLAAKSITITSVDVDALKKEKEDKEKLKEP